MAGKTSTPKKRPYNSARRQQQAAQTRADVLVAATALFSELGWAGTTLAAIAEAAEVSVETIYNGFGSKKGLLRAVMDVAVVGDDEPVAFVDRPQFAALGEGTLDERVARGVAVVADIHARSARVWEAVTEAAKGDPEVEGWRQAWESGRHLDVGRSIEVILGRPAGEPFTTMLWLLYSPESYRKLTVDAGLTREEYEAILVDATYRLARPILDAAPRPPATDATDH